MRLELEYNSSSNGSMSHFGLLTQRTMLLLRRSFQVSHMVTGSTLVGRGSLARNVTFCYRCFRNICHYRKGCVFDVIACLRCCLKVERKVIL